MYVDGELAWGTEPDGTKPSNTTPTKPNPSPTNPPVLSTLRGDVNLDGSFTAADAVAFGKFLVKSLQLTESALKNADMNADSKINVIDFTIMKRELKGK